jgi:general secretion pathway protein J
MTTFKTAGFTLVELMMAATLTTLVLGGAFVSLSVVLQAYKLHGSKSNSADMANLIFERMRMDLASTFLSPHNAVTRFVGTDLMAEELPSDTLTFISTVNNPIETGEGSSDLTEIQYYIDMDEATPERWLLRRYDPTPDMDPFSGGTIALLGPKVCMLDFQYFDGDMWWPTWDSVQEIPICVNVTIGVFEPQNIWETPTPENVEQFSTTIWIATYREPPEDSLGPMGGTSALEEEMAEGGN